MKVKLTRRVLVSQVHNTDPQPAGTVVDIDDAEAKELIANGIAEDTSSRKPKADGEDGGDEKAAQTASNKMAGDADNKDAAGTTATRTAAKSSK